MKVSDCAAAVVAILICASSCVAAVSVGLSRIFIEYGSAKESPAAVARALEFTPNDPQAHHAYGVQLRNAGRTAEAVLAFQRAVALRPDDYFFWLELGSARDDNGDFDWAVAALRHAINLAPHYSQPHWQLGNVLLRGGQSDEGFRELRKAANTNPELFMSFVDLAWSLSEANPPKTLEIIKPANDYERLQLARFLIENNEATAGLSIIGATLAASDRAALVALLINKGQFAEARRLWENGTSPAEAIFDGGFEGQIDSGEQGFAWKPETFNRVVQLARDPQNPRSGAYSLKIHYSGGIDSNASVMAQLVPVRPDTQYRLSFALRTADLESEGMPLIRVIDAGDHAVLVESEPFERGTSGWTYKFTDFKSAKTGAVLITLQRQRCSSQPCPITGATWLDDFNLTLR
jgi:tetratricopeptide (TPR) repeat protein